MKILIIGGSRFVGPHLVKLLIARKHTITVFNRGVISTKYPKGVTFIKGDRDKGFYVKEKFEGANEVEELVNLCKKYGIVANFSPFMLRGFSYYTGIVFEAYSKEIKGSILNKFYGKIKNILQMHPKT